MQMQDWKAILLIAAVSVSIGIYVTQSRRNEGDVLNVADRSLQVDQQHPWENSTSKSYDGMGTSSFYVSSSMTQLVDSAQKSCKLTCQTCCETIDEGGIFKCHKNQAAVKLGEEKFDEKGFECSDCEVEKEEKNAPCKGEFSASSDRPCMCPAGAKDSEMCADMLKATIIGISFYNALVPGVPMDIALCCPCMALKMISGTPDVPNMCATQVINFESEAFSEDVPEREMDFRGQDEADRVGMKIRTRNALSSYTGACRIDFWSGWASKKFDKIISNNLPDYYSHEETCNEMENVWPEMAFYRAQSVYASVCPTIEPYILSVELDRDYPFLEDGGSALQLFDLLYHLSTKKWKNKEKWMTNGNEHHAADFMYWIEWDLPPQPDDQTPEGWTDGRMKMDDLKKACIEQTGCLAAHTDGRLIFSWPPYDGDWSADLKEPGSVSVAELEGKKGLWVQMDVTSGGDWENLDEDEAAREWIDLAGSLYKYANNLHQKLGTMRLNEIRDKWGTVSVDSLSGEQYDFHLTKTNKKLEHALKHMRLNGGQNFVDPDDEGLFEVSHLCTWFQPEFCGTNIATEEKFNMDPCTSDRLKNGFVDDAEDVKTEWEKRKFSSTGKAQSTALREALRDRNLMQKAIDYRVQMIVQRDGLESDAETKKRVEIEVRKEFLRDLDPLGIVKIPFGEDGSRLTKVELLKYSSPSTMKKSRQIFGFDSKHALAAVGTASLASAFVAAGMLAGLMTNPAGWVLATVAVSSAGAGMLASWISGKGSYGTLQFQAYRLAKWQVPAAKAGSFNKLWCGETNVVDHMHETCPIAAGAKPGTAAADGQTRKDIERFFLLTKLIKEEYYLEAHRPDKFLPMDEALDRMRWNWWRGLALEETYSDAEIKEKCANELGDKAGVLCSNSKEHIIPLLIQKMDKDFKDSVLSAYGTDNPGDLEDRGDLGSATMTVNDAKIKCRDMHNCAGFTLEGPLPTSQDNDPRLIYFSSSYKLVASPGNFISYSFKADQLERRWKTDEKKMAKAAKRSEEEEDEKITKAFKTVTGKLKGGEKLSVDKEEREKLKTVRDALGYCYEHEECIGFTWNTEETPLDFKFRKSKEQDFSGLHVALTGKLRRDLSHYKSNVKNELIVGTVSRKLQFWPDDGGKITYADPVSLDALLQYGNSTLERQAAAKQFRHRQRACRARSMTMTREVTNHNVSRLGDEVFQESEGLYEAVHANEGDDDPNPCAGHTPKAPPDWRWLHMYANEAPEPSSEEELREQKALGEDEKPKKSKRGKVNRNLEPGESLGDTYRPSPNDIVKCIFHLMLDVTNIFPDIMQRRQREEDKEIANEHAMMQDDTCEANGSCNQPSQADEFKKGSQVTFDGPDEDMRRLGIEIGTRGKVTNNDPKKFSEEHKDPQGKPRIKVKWDGEGQTKPKLVNIEHLRLVREFQHGSQVTFDGPDEDMRRLGIEIGTQGKVTNTDPKKFSEENKDPQGKPRIKVKWDGEGQTKPKLVNIEHLRLVGDLGPSQSAKPNEEEQVTKDNVDIASELQGTIEALEIVAKLAEEPGSGEDVDGDIPKTADGKDDLEAEKAALDSKQTADLSAASWKQWSEKLAMVQDDHPKVFPKEAEEADDLQLTEMLNKIKTGMEAMADELEELEMADAVKVKEDNERQQKRSSKRVLGEISDSEIKIFNFVDKIEQVREKWESWLRVKQADLNTDEESSSVDPKALLNDLKAQVKDGKGKCDHYLNYPITPKTGLNKLTNVGKHMRNAVRAATGTDDSVNPVSALATKAKNGLCKTLAAYLRAAMNGLDMLLTDPASPMLKGAQPKGARDRSASLLNLVQIGDTLWKGLRRIEKPEEVIGKYTVPAEDTRHPIYAFVTKEKQGSFMNIKYKKGGYKSHGFVGSALGMKTQVGVACQNETFDVFAEREVKGRTYYRIKGGWIAPCEDADALSTYFARAEFEHMARNFIKRNKWALASGVLTSVGAGILVATGVMAGGLAVVAVAGLGVMTVGIAGRAIGKWFHKKDVEHEEGLAPECPKSVKQKLQHVEDVIKQKLQS